MRTRRLGQGDSRRQAMMAARSGFLGTIKTAFSFSVKPGEVGQFLLKRPAFNSGFPGCFFLLTPWPAIA